MKKQIVCFGDGMLDSKSPFADLYILAQTVKKKPRVLWLGTASGDSEGYAKYFHHMFRRFSCTTFELSLFRPDTADIADLLMSMDVILVGGGQSKSMLGVWKEWNMPKFLHDAYLNGTVLAGGSAGSVCWFNECITDSIPGTLSVMPCLGFLPYSNCPHFASYSRRAAYAKFVSSGEIGSGYAADDFAGLHFVDGKLHRSISNRPYAYTYYFSMENGNLNQKRLKTHWLGMDKYQQEFIFNSPMFRDDLSVAIEKTNDDQPLDNAV
jgi:dipeptidase E